jgi:hypothetical protein
MPHFCLVIVRFNNLTKIEVKDILKMSVGRKRCSLGRVEVRQCLL